MRSAQVLGIAQIGEPVLRERAREVTREELADEEFQAFVDDLIATMRHANGAGLAAIQVFRPIRVCALEVQDNPRYPYKPNIPLTVLVNPVLTPISSERFDNYEGCLSVPDLRGVVSRHAEIRVQAWDRHGQELDFIARGITAGTYQHECDHLDGKLFVDRVEDPSSFTTWKGFTRYKEAEFKARVQRVVERWGS